MCRFVVWSKETIACQRVYIKRECVNSVCGLFPSVACREEEGRGNKYTNGILCRLVSHKGEN